jgi:hypothetical protein
LASHLLQPVTFTIFYPVIALAALLGGARAGSVALGLAALSADFFFIAPRFTFYIDAAAVVPTGVFLVVGAMLVTLVSLLNLAVDRISREAAATKQILEDQPVGVMLVDAHGTINFVATPPPLRRENSSPSYSRKLDDGEARGWARTVARMDRA